MLSNFQYSKTLLTCNFYTYPDFWYRWHEVRSIMYISIICTCKLMDTCQNPSFLKGTRQNGVITSWSYVIVFKIHIRCSIGEPEQSDLRSPEITNSFSNNWHLRRDIDGQIASIPLFHQDTSTFMQHIDPIGSPRGLHLRSNFQFVLSRWCVYF